MLWFNAGILPSDPARPLKDSHHPLVENEWRLGVQLTP